MKIKAFGKRVGRDRAYKIIIDDKIADICHARNTDTLEDLLMNGWKSLEAWSDEQLEQYISELLVENQPNVVGKGNAKHFIFSALARSYQDSLRDNIKRGIAQAKLNRTGRYAKRNN